VTVRDLADSLNRNEQVDGIFLDFSKGFATSEVTIKARLLWTSWNMHSSIKDFLTNRKQEVVLEGKHSSRSEGTVFGPLLFLIFINDITNNTSSTARLFVNDCVLYSTINCEADAITLQKDQETMEQWEAKWLKEFNLE
jgi:hypothetical protein